MSTTSTGPEIITADAAVTALVAAAWTEPVSEDKLAAAVEAVMELATAVEPCTDPLIPASRIRSVVRAALGDPPRTRIHCMTGALGADWDLVGVTELALSDGAVCAWVPDLFRHELAVRAGGKVYRFDVVRPA